MLDIAAVSQHLLLQAQETVAAGRFVIEYVGELITMAEYRTRMAADQAAGQENYYYLTIDSNRMIDAGPKGNLARFMNHSCDPNCITEKWTGRCSCCEHNRDLLCLTCTA